MFIHPGKMLCLGWISNCAICYKGWSIWKATELCKGVDIDVIIYCALSFTDNEHAKIVLSLVMKYINWPKFLQLI